MQPAQCSWWIIKKNYGPGEGSVEVSGGPCADGTERPFLFMMCSFKSAELGSVFTP